MGKRLTVFGLIALLAINASFEQNASFGQDARNNAKEKERGSAQRPARSGPSGKSDQSGKSTSTGKGASTAKTGDGSKEEKLPGFTLEREAAALSFVRQHHPELADLLAQLKAGNRREYQKAVHELFRTSERLAMARERDSARYELELEAWKLDSRIRLLAARMTMSENNAESLEELKTLLLERTDVQLKRQMLDRQRLVGRLEKLDAAIETTRREREQQARQSLDKLLKGIQESRPDKSRGKSSANLDGTTTSAASK